MDPKCGCCEQRFPAKDIDTRRGQDRIICPMCLDKEDLLVALSQAAQDLVRKVNVIRGPIFGQPKDKRQEVDSAVEEIDTIISNLHTNDPMQP